jgi:hypothetical protein
MLFDIGKPGQTPINDGLINAIRAINKNVPAGF